MGRAPMVHSTENELDEGRDDSVGMVKASGASTPRSPSQDHEQDEPQCGRSAPAPHAPRDDDLARRARPDAISPVTRVTIESPGSVTRRSPRHRENEDPERRRRPLRSFRRTSIADGRNLIRVRLGRRRSVLPKYLRRVEIDALAPCGDGPLLYSPSATGSAQSQTGPTLVDEGAPPCRPGPGFRCSSC